MPFPVFVLGLCGKLEAGVPGFASLPIDLDVFSSHFTRLVKVWVDACGCSCIWVGRCTCKCEHMCQSMPPVLSLDALSTPSEGGPLI